jgi:cholesterol transport system auxiliary component
VSFGDGRALLAFASICVCSCALLGKSDALTPRYFSPDVWAARKPVKPASLRTDQVPPALRLGRVTAAAYLNERIAFRSSNYELSFYEERRWTEKPEAYLRRALSSSLFEEHGLRRIVSGPGPTLEVELTEFAELRAPSPQARVRATYILYDQRLVRREATVTVELPIASSASQHDAPERAVRAMTDALSAAVTQIVDRVTVDLESTQPGPSAQSER